MAPPEGDTDAIRGAGCIVKEADVTEKSTKFWLTRTLEDVDDDVGNEAVDDDSKCEGVRHCIADAFTSVADTSRWFPNRHVSDEACWLNVPKTVTTVETPEKPTQGETLVMVGNAPYVNAISLLCVKIPF